MRLQRQINYILCYCSFLLCPVVTEVMFLYKENKFIFISMLYYSCKILLFQNQLGMFSSKQHFFPMPPVPLFENLLRQVPIPTEQTGFPDVAGRPRERIHLYDPLLLEIGNPPMVRRRSSVLYNFPIDPYLLECESSFSQNYQYVFSTALVHDFLHLQLYM